MSSKDISIKNLHTIIFDFDGVFTDNYVYVDNHGNETVRCSRADSYGINLLKVAKTKREDLLDFFVQYLGKLYLQPKL